MQAKRASAILKSDKEVEVHYANNPIWIKAVDPEAVTATVRILGTNDELVVPLSKLHEV